MNIKIFLYILMLAVMPALAMADSYDEYRMPEATGLINYGNGFWAYNMKDKLGCVEDGYMSYMSGFGGLCAVILPGKMGYYSISDGGTHAFVNALAEQHKIAPFCKGESNG